MADTVRARLAGLVEDLADGVTTTARHLERVPGAVDRISDAIRAAGQLLVEEAGPGGCPAHGVHPHHGMRCLDCPDCDHRGHQPTTGPADA